MKKQHNLLWFLIDGLPFWLVERYQNRSSKLPQLSALFQKRRVAELHPVFPNCQTPPSLATLFSGSLPKQHGITGFDLPDLHSDTPTESKPAFRFPLQNVSFIWDHYANHGQTIRLCQIPFVDKQRISKHTQVASYGFTDPLFLPTVQVLNEISTKIHLEKMNRVVIIEEISPAIYRIMVETDTHEIVDQILLKSEQWSAIRLTSSVKTIVSIYNINYQNCFIGLGAWNVNVFGQKAEDFRQHHKQFPFLASGLSKLYQAGKLGQTLHNAGNGKAERIFFQSIKCLSQRYLEELLFSLECQDSDLTLVYQPALDLLFHQLIGFLDESMTYFSIEAQQIVDSIIEQTLIFVDQWIGVIQGKVPSNSIAIISSDHGMSTIDTIIYPNQILLEEGWLSIDKNGKINAFESLCFFHPAETGVLCFNKRLLGNKVLETQNEVFQRLLERLHRTTRRKSGTVEFKSPHLENPNFTSENYLVPGMGQVAKSDVNLGIHVQSRKTGDHCIANHDPRLNGVIIDLNGQLLRQNETSVKANEVVGRMLNPE